MPRPPDATITLAGVRYDLWLGFTEADPSAGLAEPLYTLDRAERCSDGSDATELLQAHDLDTLLTDSLGPSLNRKASHDVPPLPLESSYE